MSADQENIKSLLRSVLQSSQYPIQIFKIENEFKFITGEVLPYRALGFQNVSEYLKSIPDTVKISGSGNTAVIQAVATGDTAHISKLVNQQKKASKGSTVSKSIRRGSGQYQYRQGRPNSLLRGQQYPQARKTFSQPNYPPRGAKRFDSYEVPPRLQPQRNANLRVSFECSSEHTNNHQLDHGYARTVVRTPLLPNPTPPLPAGISRPPPPCRFQSPESMAWKKPEQPAEWTRPQSAAPLRPSESTEWTRPQSAAPLRPSEPTVWARQEQVKPLRPEPPSWKLAELAGRSRTDPPAASRPVATAAKRSKSPGRVPTPSSNKTRLDERATKYNLGAVSYKTSAFKLKQEILYISKVVVGDRTFSSYPIESKSKAESEQEAARCALEDLETELGDKSDELRVSPVSCIVRRIYELIQDKATGYYNYHIQEKYLEKYRERLPDSWITFILAHDSFTVSKINEKKSIVYPKRPDYKEISNSNEDSGSSVGSRASSPAVSTPTRETPVAGQEISLPPDSFWNVYVSNVVSADSVWLRLVGPDYSDKYEELANDLDLFYMGDPATPIPEEVAENDLLAVMADKCWHRVIVQEVRPNDEFVVRFVDHGDVEVRNRADLRPLGQQFWELPYQAILCRLAGLEGLDDLQLVTNLTSMTVSKTLVAEILSRDDAILILLYDTSTNVDVNVNQKILEMALTEVSRPVLKGVTEVIISHVDAKGDIFVQPDIREVELLGNLLEMVSWSERTVDLTPDTVYLVLDETGTNRRCVLPGTSALREVDGKVDVTYVDFGHEESVDSRCIYSIESSVLATLPYQAIRCRLSGVPSTPDLVWSEGATARLLELIADYTLVTARVVGSSSGSREEDVPRIEAFVRDATTNQPISVGGMLNKQVDLFTKKSSLSSAKRKITKKVGATAVRRVEIECVNLPNLHEDVDVHITLAASPFNFVFQLLTTGKQFDDLQRIMQDFYDENKGLPVPTDDIKAQRTFAACHLDMWYRVCANGDEMDGMVSIYFLDYGDHNFAPVESLRKLEDDFKRLPTQALRGKMAGIIPLYGDWQTEDSLRFKELVEEKDLVARVIGYDMPDAEGHSHLPNLVVQLVDTSDPQRDIFIDQVLVAENRARIDDCGTGDVPQ